MATKLKPKVIYILPNFDPQTPSHHNHIFELLEELGKSVDIHLIIERSSEQAFIKNMSYISQQKYFSPPLNLLERTVLLLRARANGYKNCYVHYSYWGAILSSLILRPLGGKVYYWHCEWYENFHSNFNFSANSIKKIIFDEWAMILTLKLIDQLVTGTKSLKDFYSAEFNLSKSKIAVIPNWINLNRFKMTKAKKDGKTILFAHKLSPRKGVDYLPEIINKVLKEVPDAKFKIIGDGPSRNNLQNKIKSMKLTASAQLLGAVPNTKMPTFYNKADVFIMPSKQEGFPRVLLESMATGVPFVTFEVGGVKDMLNNNQAFSIVKSGDIEKFSNKIINLLKDRKKHLKLSKAGLSQVKKYSLEKVSVDFIKLFTK